MDDGALTSSPLSSAPSSLVTSAKSNEPRLPPDTRPATLEHPMSKADNEEVAVALKDTSPSASSITVPNTIEDHAAKQLNKRIREEYVTQDGERSKRKKAATEADVKADQSAPAEAGALDEATVAEGGRTAVDDGASSSDELAESKKPARKPKPKPKAAPNKKVAPLRRGPPACAECKRRKVKCKHNRLEKSDTGIDNRATDPFDGAVSVEGKPTKNMESDEAANVAKVGDVHNDDEAHEGKSTKEFKAKKKPTSKPARAPPERTSTRNRKAPERFEDLQELPPSRASPPKKGASRVFDPIYITTNSTSRLGRADIYHMLLEDSAWTSLSSSQQATLVSMFPDSAENQRLLAMIKAGGTGKDTRPQWLKASDVFRDEVAKFKDDLTNGHLAKTWQAAAEQAVVERAKGEYDKWKAEEAELWWGQKSK